MSSEDWSKPLKYLLCPQCLECVSAYMITRDEDIWTVSCDGVHRLRWDCGCKGIHCSLCAQQGMDAAFEKTCSAALKICSDSRKTFPSTQSLCLIMAIEQATLLFTIISNNERAASCALKCYIHNLDFKSVASHIFPCLLFSLFQLFPLISRVTQELVALFLKSTPASRLCVLPNPLFTTTYTTT